MSTLEQEVRTLQKQVRRQRRWNIALGAMVVVGGLMAATSSQSVPDVIQAKRFEVVNDEGKVIVGIGANENGGLLGIRNKDGKRVAAIYANAVGGGMFDLHTKDGERDVEAQSPASGEISKQAAVGSVVELTVNEIINMWDDNSRGAERTLARLGKFRLKGEFGSYNEVPGLVYVTLTGDCRSDGSTRILNVLENGCAVEWLDSLSKGKETSVLVEFHDRFRSVPPTFRCVAETQGPSFLDPDDLDR